MPALDAASDGHTLALVASRVLALAPRFRQRQRICCRCRAPYDDEHVCHDRVRHPGVERLFLALQRMQSRANDPHAAALLEQLRRPTVDPGRVAAQDPELLAEVLGIALLWANLPSAEQTVANAILEHAGYPTLEVA